MRDRSPQCSLALGEESRFLLASLCSHLGNDKGSELHQLLYRQEMCEIVT